MPPDLSEKFEKTLHPFIAFGIMPLFAFVNAGVPLQGLTFSALLQPLPLGIMLGLFIGKQIGIFGAIFISVKTGLAALPRYVDWRDIYGMSMLCGVGFTMSLFIGMLAYQEAADLTAMRLGVLGGSLISALAGYLFLRFATLSK
jgi:NhaA family Na+:H+ antiporter